jgi:hypothetical protein
MDSATISRSLRVIRFVVRHNSQKAEWVPYVRSLRN